MTGNDNLQAENTSIDIIAGDVNEPTQRGTPAAPPPTQHKPTGPFNFTALTSQYKIGIIKSGITKNQLEAIKSETDFDYRTLSRLLSVSRTTLIKKKGDEKFDQPTSERILILAEFIHYGQEVFESREHFNTWIKEPIIALGNKAPIELLDTVYGIEEVKKELDRRSECDNLIM